MVHVFGISRIGIVGMFLVALGLDSTATAQIDRASSQDDGDRIVVSPQLQKLSEIQQRMRSVVTRLDRADTSARVQELQLSILNELDEMLAEAGEQEQASPTESSSTSESSSQGQTSVATENERTDEMDRDGEGGGGRGPDTPSSRESIEATWGKLPARLQEQMRAAMSVDYLPKYEKLIEGYYKRLAEADLNGS